jgi:hypothetical protein
MNSDGTEETRLTLGSSASWDPSSKNIAFHASASGTYGTRLPARTEPGAPTTDSDIFLVNLDDLLENGKLPTNLTNGLPSQQPPGCECRFASDDPDWSPDGKWIAFTSRFLNKDGTVNQSSRGIYVVKLMTGEVTKLTNLNNDVAEERSPAWSPDGTRIVIMRRPAPGQPFEIYVLHLSVDPLTETITVVTDIQLTNNSVPDLSAAWFTEEKILFHRGPLINQIYVINANGQMCVPGACSEKALTGPSAPPPAALLTGQSLFPKWGRIAVGQDPAPE